MAEIVSYEGIFVPPTIDAGEGKILQVTNPLIHIPINRDSKLVQKSGALLYTEDGVLQSGVRRVAALNVMALSIPYKSLTERELSILFKTLFDAGPSYLRQLVSRASIGLIKDPTSEPVEYTSYRMFSNDQPNVIGAVTQNSFEHFNERTYFAVIRDLFISPDSN